MKKILLLIGLILITSAYFFSTRNNETIVLPIQEKNILQSGSTVVESGTVHTPTENSIQKSFESIPEEHKESVGYIFITSANMDIRWKDMKPEEYFKAIYSYNSWTLEVFDFRETEKLNTLYEHAKKYINIISERKLDRFSVGFTTKTYAYNNKKADIYLSSEYLSDILFIHEFGHVVDYKYGFTDINKHIYPYKKRADAITEYGKFHIGEDFAEAYRYYILHGKIFREMSKENPEIQEKYEYMKKHVFNGVEYGRL